MSMRNVALPALARLKTRVSITARAGVAEKTRADQLQQTVETLTAARDEKVKQIEAERSQMIAGSSMAANCMFDR